MDAGRSRIRLVKKTRFAPAGRSRVRIKECLRGFLRLASGCITLAFALIDLLTERSWKSGKSGTRWECCINWERSVRGSPSETSGKLFLGRQQIRWTRTVDSSRFRAAE